MPDSIFSKLSYPTAIAIIKPIADHIEYRPPTKSQNSNIYSTSTRILSGLITPAILLYSAIGLIGCVIGDSVGRTVFNRLDSAKLKHVIYLGMILSGIIMLIR